MKKNIYRGFLAGMAALALTACSEDSWNNQLDGFEGGANMDQVETVSYTLTDGDYARIANNRFNKALAAKQHVADALKAVETNKYLSAEIPADQYIPNLLKDSLFAYYGLSDGSSINLTYREVNTALPEKMKGMTGAATYEVTDADYQIVYGSTTDYATSFAPSWPAASNIPSLLADAYDDAESGQYVVVSYNTSDVDPNFGTPEPEFEYTSILGNNLSAGDDVEVKCQVMALCTRGMIVADKSGAILVYGSDFPADTYAIGDNLTISATLSNYKNCLQIGYSDATVKPEGKASAEYPAPVELDENYLVNANLNETPVCAVYGHMTGTVSVSGNYYNIILGDEAMARGSVYYADDATKAKLQDGAKVSLLGYFTQTSTSGDMVNANIVVVDVESAAAAKRRGAPRKIVTVPSTEVYQAYVYDGSRWKTADSDIVVLQPSDYAAMEQGYGNLSGTQPAEFLPTWLAAKYPYAQADKTLYVAYLYYSNKETKYACGQWIYNGSEWEDEIAANGVQTVTNQFVKRDGVWQLDPSIELTLPAGRGQSFSAEFYQACVDWVKNNVPDGAAYITSYGNNDYYTGCSAYQNNIDLRASAAKDQYAGYKEMSDEEVVALEKKRFETEVCPGVLAQRYPEIAPVGDFQPTVTIHFYTYNGSTTDPQTIVYKVTAKATFEFVSCTWND